LYRICGMKSVSCKIVFIGVKFATISTERDLNRKKFMFSSQNAAANINQEPSELKTSSFLVQHTAIRGTIMKMKTNNSPTARHFIKNTE